MAATLSSKTISPKEFAMPNIRGLLHAVTNQLWPEVLFAAVITWAVAICARRSDLRFGLAAVIVGSLLVSHHAGPQDCTLLVPALLILVQKAKSIPVHVLCLIMLCPVPYVFLMAPGADAITQTLILLLLFAIVFEAHHASSATVACERASASLT